jgi:hypothetical protein
MTNVIEEYKDVHITRIVAVLTAATWYPSPAKSTGYRPVEIFARWFPHGVGDG